MSERLLDFDPLTGISQFIDTDEMTGISTIRTSQDVEGIIESNKIHQRQFTSGKDKWGDGYDHRTKVASIPLSIWTKLKAEIGNDPVALRRWLNEPDNFAFRTRPGNV